MTSKALLGAALFAVAVGDVLAIDLVLAPRVWAAPRASHARSVETTSPSAPTIASAPGVAVSAPTIASAPGVAVSAPTIASAPASSEPAPAVRAAPAAGASTSEAPGAADLVTILFPRDSISLSRDAADAIDAFAERAKREPDARIAIDGYADRTGLTSFNQRLSEERARVVADRLTRRGLPSERLFARGRGDESPIDLGASPDALARNRRVELRLSRPQ